MRVFYWSKKQIAKMLLVMTAILVMVVVGFNILEDDIAVTTLASQPIYQGDTSLKSIGLTINVDWGEDFIPGMLETLKENKAKATFFMTGRFADKFPELVKTIASDGHEIGNHGYSHPHPDRISKKENQEEITKTAKAIHKACGIETTLFAPPYGEHKPHVVEAAGEIGYKTILWTIDTVDWEKSRGSEDIYLKVTKNAQNGAIVLMHPTDRTLKAFDRIIKKLQLEGFKIAILSQILP